MPVPNVTYTVEIAFNSNWKTPAGSRVWTDVSDYVELQEGIKIDVGRSDELSTADANELTLTLDNKDGRFTWGNAASPYYPNVKIGKPIRVTATLDGNAPSTRFVGFIDEWPVEWPGESSTYAQATISAKSRLAWIGLTAPTLFPTDQEIVSWGVAYYWPLTDPLGATVATESSGQANATVVGDCDFEHVLSTFAGWADGRTGVRLNGTTSDKTTGRLTAGLPTAMQLKTTAGSGFSIGAFLHVADELGSPTDPVVTLLDSSGADGIRIGQASATLTIGGSVSTVAFPTLNLVPAHVLVTIEPIGGGDNVMSVYHNGFLYGSATGNTGSTITLDQVTAQGSWDGGSVYADIGIGRLAIWDSTLSATAAHEITYAGLFGFQERTNERMARLGRWAGIPSAEVLATFSEVHLAAFDSTDGQVVDLMRQAEVGEGGFLFDEPGGSLRLQPRSHRYNQAGTTLAFTTDRIGGYAPKVDRAGLVNVGVGKGVDEVEVRYENQESREAYGDASYEVETSTIAPTDDPLQIIAWKINGSYEPRPRVPAPKFSVLDWAGTSAFPLQAVTLGSKVILTNAPAQAPNASSAAFFVEGYTEEIGVGVWDISPNLSPVVLEDLALVLDSATDGVLDTDVLAF